MIKKVRLEGILKFKDEKDRVEEEWKEYVWEREGWERHEEAWRWALEDWLWEIAEEKLKKKGIDIIECNHSAEFEWYEFNNTKELNLYITKYGKTEEEDQDYLFTFKIMEEEYEEEEEE